MQIFFWDFQDNNDIVREWIMFIINILVLAFTTFALIRTWRYYRECMFEMMPLSINFIATFILLMLKLFEKGYEFDEIGHLIQIFTYLLFCYTFAIMYTLIKNPDKRKKVQRTWNIILGVFFILLVLFSILVFMGIISKKCDKQKQQWPAIFSLIFEFVSFLPTVYYGVKILTRMIHKQDKKNKNKNKEELGNLGNFTSQIYIRERKKQIAIVLAIYFISLIIRLILTLVMIFFWDKLFQCKNIENLFLGQLFLVLAQLNELLPHIVIPFAMYVVPLQKLSKSKTVDLNQRFLDEDQNDDKYSDHSLQQDIRVRVSTLITNRTSMQNSPRKKKNETLKTQSK